MSRLDGYLEQLNTSAEAEETLRGFIRISIAFAILLAVLISTKPFNPPPTIAVASTGDLANQLTFSGLAVAAGLMLFFSPRGVFRPLVQPSWIILFSWLIVCVVRSDFVGISFRAFAFNLIIIFLTAMLFILPERISHFQKLIIGAVILCLGLSYLGVIALPHLGKHTDFDPFEPEHSGSWKGHFDHKNVAGAVMAIFAFVGVYAARVGYRRLGVAIVLLSVVFLYFTKSKTAFALVPVALVLTFLAEKIRFLPFRIAVTVVPVLGLLALTLGSALVPEIADFNKSVLKDPSFTGRFDIWRYGFEKWAERPWAGYGLEAFWQTDTTLQGESKLELAWEAQKIIHGHNSYLDIGLTTGLIGLALVLYVFVLKPVLDFHACDTTVETRPLASMLLGIWLFISMDMNLETFYFRRADPVWFLLLFAVIGLRFTATFPVSQEPSQVE